MAPDIDAHPDYDGASALVPRFMPLPQPLAEEPLFLPNDEDADAYGYDYRDLPSSPPSLLQSEQVEVDEEVLGREEEAVVFRASVHQHAHARGKGKGKGKERARPPSAIQVQRAPEGMYKRRRMMDVETDIRLEESAMQEVVDFAQAAEEQQQNDDMIIIDRDAPHDYPTSPSRQQVAPHMAAGPSRMASDAEQPTLIADSPEPQPLAQYGPSEPFDRPPRPSRAPKPAIRSGAQAAMGALLQDEDQVFVPDPQTQMNAAMIGPDEPSLGEGEMRSGASGAGSGEDMQEEKKEEEREWNSYTILSVHCPNGYNVAVAVWKPEDRKVFVMEDTKDTTAYDLIALVMEQVQPNYIIMSCRAPNDLYDRVKEHCDESSIAKVALQNHASYTDRQALSALAQARLTDMAHGARPSDTGHSSHGEEMSTIDSSDEYPPGDEGAGLGRMRLAMVKLGCRANLEAPAARAAAGGLLVYMQKQKMLAAKYDGEPGILLEGIESLALHQHMVINQDALTSLAIFDIEGHAFSNTDRTKQALSVFGLLNTCVTTAGRRLFHTWFLRPLLSLPDITERHDAVELFTAQDNFHGARIMKKHMQEIKNVCRVMRLLRKGDGRVKDWKTLTDALMAFMMVRDQILGISRSRPVLIIERVINSVDGSMPALAQIIIDTIDWDASREQERVCVRRGVNQMLDQKKEELAALESHLDAISRKIAANVDPQFYHRLKVQYLPQLGFLTAISPAVQPVPPPMGWEGIFSTDDTQYFKNPQMRNMDDHFGDIETDVQDMEIEIVQELVDKLRDVDAAVTVANDAVAELDCLIALAEAAYTYNLVRPTMVLNPMLRIKNGRHMLHAAHGSDFIPNNTAVSGGNERATGLPSMLIVTGANGSGKSVYGKQVAIIAFMAQIGSFVPAESATIGLVDKRSAFMIDLSQVAMALRGATERSLLVLDEFGKGTTSADGAGLLAGVIEHLQQGACPRTIVLTHFHELFAQQILSETDKPVLFCHMRSIMERTARRLTFQYKLEPGMSQSSNAAECAAAHGIPDEVIERARFVTECVATSEMTKIYETELTEDEWAELKEAEQLAYRFLAWEIDEGRDVRIELDEMLDMFDREMGRLEVQDQDSARLQEIEQEDE